MITALAGVVAGLGLMVGMFWVLDLMPMAAFVAVAILYGLGSTTSSHTR